MRDVLPTDAEDQTVLRYAAEHSLLMVTCNRDDFLGLARTSPHHGIIIIIRRKTRAAERAALVQLLDRTGETGLISNINFS
jgi:predicted nuclease of predicted toxin-antitoxin system